MIIRLVKFATIGIDYHQMNFMVNVNVIHHE